VFVVFIDHTRGHYTFLEGKIQMGYVIVIKNLLAISLNSCFIWIVDSLLISLPIGV